MVKITDFHHAVGKNGDAVPLPPDLFPTEGPAVSWFLSLPKRALIALLAVLVISVAGQIGKATLPELLQRIALAVGFIVLAMAAIAATMIFIPWGWWLFERRVVGRRLEDEIEALSNSELDERIADTQRQFQEAEGAKKAAYGRRVEWLRMQRAGRQP